MKNKTKKSAKRGFTLIELMIVVAIIGILAAVAIPKFADLIAKSKEGATKGSLGAIRSALAVYYGDWEGWFPIDDDANSATLQTTALDCLVPKYMKSIVKAKIPRAKDHGNPSHPDNTQVIGTSTAGYVTDAGGWSYADQVAEPDWGEIVVNCSHSDSKGRLWTTY